MTDDIDQPKRIIEIYGDPSAIPKLQRAIIGSAVNTKTTNQVIGEIQDDLATGTDFLIRNPDEDERRKMAFDIIQRAKHYNMHPSGIEAIELCEKMPFNTGNAFKYLYRCGNKGAPEADIQKAVWYVKREIVRLNILHANAPHSSFVHLFSNEFTEVDKAKVQLVVAEEDDPLKAEIFYLLLRSTTTSSYACDLQIALGKIEELLMDEEDEDEDTDD